MADWINCKEAGVAGASCCQSDGSSVFSCLGILFRSRYQKSTGEEKKGKGERKLPFSLRTHLLLLPAQPLFFQLKLNGTLAARQGLSCSKMFSPFFYAGQK